MVVTETLVSFFKHHVNPKIGWVRSADAEGADEKRKRELRDKLDRSFADAAQDFLDHHPLFTPGRPVGSLAEVEVLPERSVVVDDDDLSWALMGGLWVSPRGDRRTAEFLFDMADQLTVVFVPGGVVELPLAGFAVTYPDGVAVYPYLFESVHEARRQLAGEPDVDTERMVILPVADLPLPVDA